MKDNKELIYKSDPLRERHDVALIKISELMKEARIDTLLHLKKQFEVNAKKLNSESALLLVDELIKEIKK